MGGTMAKIFLVSLILLLFVLSFVVSLHLYSKWFLRHREQQQPPSSSSVSAATTTTVVIRRRRTDSSSVCRGLDVRVLRSIPVMVLEEGGSANGSSTECAVCLCEVAKGDKYRLLPKCRHGFHVDCIDMWFASHATCPLCRDPVSVPGLTLVAKKPRSEVNLDAILETTRAENAAMFPTNVLFWGNQTQVSTRQLRATEEGTTGATSSATVAIDMPRQTTGEEDEELSGLVTTRFRSLKRMLSRDRKINPCSPNGDASTQS